MSETKAVPYRLKIVGSEIRVLQPEEIEKSFFREEYKSIFRAVENVIKSSEADNRRSKDAMHENRYNPDVRIHNIIPIIGPRGSGKSSILNAVAGIFNDSAAPEVANSDFFRQYYETGRLFNNRKFFVTKKIIDGALLEPHEDIFLTILAQMYDMLPEDMEPREGVYSGSHQQLREVRKKLEELYGNARQMEEKASDDRRDDISNMNALKQLSDSLRLRQNFRELLLKFLEICTHNPKLKPNNYRWYRDAQPRAEDCYLVIPIDDLDLNVEHGYRMLEKIHRYLMLPNVIILLSFEQDQFKRLGEFYFYQMIPKYDSRMNDAAPRIDELAHQYLEKVMPLNLRTYMPRLATHIDVNVEMEDDKQPALPPKYLAFRLLYEKLGIRMDTDGEKPHFLVRDSLRDYVNSMNQLLIMASPFLKKTANVFFDEEIFRHNHRVYHQEITQGMATTWLSDAASRSQYRVDTATTVSTYTYQPLSAKALFEEIIKAVNPIPRTFRNFFFHVLREGREPAANRILRDLASSMDRYGFSYGEILHIIYHYGRISRENKRLIHCLLAYYSLMMNHCYLNLRQCRPSNWLNSGDSHADDAEKDTTKAFIRCRDEFLKLMNGSVAGSWANSMVPVVRGTNKFYGAGLRIVKNMNKALYIEAIHIREYFAGKDFDGADKIRMFFRSMLIIGMLFDRPNYKLPESFNFDFLTNEEKNEWESLLGSLMEVVPAKTNLSAFQPISGKGTFGFLNFVSSAFQYPEYIQKLLDYTAIYAKSRWPIFHISDKKSDVEECVDTVRTELELAFTAWNKQYFSFALPLYDLDVCYNLVKRLLQDRYGKQDYIYITQETDNNIKETGSNTKGADNNAKDTDSNTKGADNNTKDTNNTQENGITEEALKSAEKTFLLDTYIDIYIAIARRLESNDDVYAKQCGVRLDGSAPRPCYADAFYECPFIKWLGRQEDGSIGDKTAPTTELTRKLLDIVFNNLITNEEISESHADNAVYQPIASYDD